jgi:hypothetical protein
MQLLGKIEEDTKKLQQKVSTLQSEMKECEGRAGEALRLGKESKAGVEKSETVADQSRRIAEEAEGRLKELEQDLNEAVQKMNAFEKRLKDEHAAAVKKQGDLSEEGREESVAGEEGSKRRGSRGKRGRLSKAAEGCQSMVEGEKEAEERQAASAVKGLSDSLEATAKQVEEHGCTMETLLANVEQLRAVLKLPPAGAEVKEPAQEAEASRATPRSSPQTSSLEYPLPHEGHDAIEALKLDIYWARREFEKRIKECQEKLAACPPPLGKALCLNSRVLQGLTEGKAWTHANFRRHIVAHLFAAPPVGCKAAIIRALLLIIRSMQPKTNVSGERRIRGSEWNGVVQQ